MINKIFIKLFNHDENKLFVLQAQRTAKTLLGKPSEYEKKFSKKVTDYVLNIKNDKILLEKTNIIMRDFIVSDMNKVNNILSLNLDKNLVNVQSVVEFKRNTTK